MSQPPQAAAMGFKQRRDKEQAAAIHAEVPAALLENRAWHWHGAALEQRRPPLSNLARALTTHYPSLDGKRHRAAQLIPAAMRHVDLSTAAEGLSVERGYARPKVDAPAAARQARQLLRGIAADQTPSTIRRVMASAHFIRYMYRSRIYVDTDGLERIRALSATHTLVFVPTHKSHLDYMTLCYILFVFGLTCPHIAAGINLNLPVVGRILRGLGAFFIRRKFTGLPDSSLYREVLAGYIRAVLEEGLPIEVFIEGGRSRDGRITLPRLGILSFVVDAFLDGRMDKDIALVPISVSYDRPAEEHSLVTELSGIPKEKESLASLLAAAGSLAVGGNGRKSKRGRYVLGADIMRVGEIVTLERFLAAVAEGVAVAKTPRLCTPSAVRLTATSSGISVDEAAIVAAEAAAAGGKAPAALVRVFPEGSDARRKAGELARRGALFNPVHAGEGGGEPDVTFFAELLPDSLEAREGCGQEALRTVAGPRARLSTQYRYNQLLPPFAADALLVASLLAVARAAPEDALGASEAAVVEEAAWLRALLAADLDTAVGPEGLRTPAAIAGVLGQLVTAGTLVRSPDQALRLARDSDGGRAAAFGASLLSPLLATYCAALPLAVEALRRAPGGALPAKKLLRCIQVALWEGTPQPPNPAMLPEPGKAGSGEDEGGLEPLAMDKSFSVAFASQLSAAGDAVNAGAPGGESTAERIARIVTPRASARAKAAKAARAAAAEAARMGGLSGPGAEVLQLREAFRGGPDAVAALAARMQAFMWA
ncbi:hypothetical protein WJX81_007257 [Elliptochloris bilobata]|uniref:Phospholipid/glycerol acyltransferase domain-containing protein n=1 Tax=Elliptochloris bilobata TaxID=381761 RepID=A0AAW1S7V1_9CHLO